MGGGQNYIKNKKEFLEQNGYKVLILSKNYGKVLISEFLQYTKWINPIFNYYPGYFSNFDKLKYFKKIREYCGDSEEIIIESDCPELALWGELLAELLNAKHICYVRDEKPILKNIFSDYFEFKLRRRELAGIHNKTLAILFKNIRVIKEEEKYTLIAAGTSVNIVKDFHVSLLDNIPEADYNIGSIGRLNKPYVIPMCKELVLFAHSIPDKKINVLFIGGSFDGKTEKEIINIFGEISNINVIMLGYMRNIPNQFFEIIDIGIASAGSAGLFWRQEVITISIDGNDYMPIGVLGYSTQNRLFRTNEERIKLSALLKKVLFEQYLDNFTFTKCPEINIEDTYRQHMLFINNSIEVKEYFDISLVPSTNKSKLLLFVQPINAIIFSSKYIFNIIIFIRSLKKLKNLSRKILYKK
jgi:hypothetical protein